MMTARYLMPLAVLAVMAGQPALATGNIERGADLFDAHCAECHSVKAGKNKKGPSLFAAIGRKAGSVPDYAYSEALKQSGIVWTPDKWAAYVNAPKSVVPGGKMKFDGKLSPQDTADLMAFLMSVH